MMLGCILFEVRFGVIFGCDLQPPQATPDAAQSQGGQAYRCRCQFAREVHMGDLSRRLWSNEEGQDIAEYAVMLAVILVIVVGTIRLIGANANNVFSSVASSISQ